MTSTLFPSSDELDEILVGPDSVSWRRTSDVRLNLVMVHALLLQVAHPTVGAGVEDFSDFERDPWPRLMRTIDYVTVLVYGGERAVMAGRRLRELHRHFRGVRPGSGERFPHARREIQAVRSRRAGEARINRDRTDWIADHKGQVLGGFEIEQAADASSRRRRERGLIRGGHPGRLLGIGTASYVEICGFEDEEVSDVVVGDDGRVTVLTGSASHGQGHETSYAQLVADELQIPMSLVTVVHGDTERVDPAEFALDSARDVGRARLTLLRRL